MNNMKKQRKPVEWERLDISSRKLALSREHFIKDRNGKDIIEAEEIKKSGKNTQKELYKKGLNDPDNHDGADTHPVRHPGV